MTKENFTWGRPSTEKPRTKQARSSEKFEVLVFVSKDDPGLGKKRGEELVDTLKKLQVKDLVSVRLIDKRGFDIDDLTLVASHRVVATPTVLILRSGKVVFRQAQLPSIKILQDLFS